MFSKNKQFAVLGLGRFGQSIVKTLSESGHHVLACDINLDIVNDMAEYATHAIQVDITDEKSIAALGLGSFDVVIIGTGESMEASIMATLLSKENGASYVIAKATSASMRTILEKVGADKVVLPEYEIGQRLATNLITSNIIDCITLSGKFVIVEIEPLKEWTGKTLQKANIRADYSINIVALKRGKKMVVSPKATEVILSTDILLAIGEKSDIQRLTQK